MSKPVQVRAVDAFDLPDWLGLDQVTWQASSSVHSPRVQGQLCGPGEQFVCDLLAVDQAYPEPVISEHWRGEAHRSWTHGQVLLVEYDGRLTLAVPGTTFTADLVLEALARLAKAVGVKPERFVAALRL